MRQGHVIKKNIKFDRHYDRGLYPPYEQQGRHLKQKGASERKTHTYMR